mgnify:CR=1 FL=1
MPRVEIRKEETDRDGFHPVFLELPGRAPDGGFYAARDADSEGVEGAFYVWTVEEIRDALAGSPEAEDSELFNREACFAVPWQVARI